MEEYATMDLLGGDLEVEDEILDADAELPHADQDNGEKKVTWSLAKTTLDDMGRSAEPVPDSGGNKPSVSQDLQDQDDELRALGISVVDQWSLERDVEAAVNKVVTKHTRAQRLKILKKEIKDVQDNIKKGSFKLSCFKERLSAMMHRVVDPRQYMSVESEMKTKEQELKALREKETYLQNKLASAEENEEELDNIDLEDGEVVDSEEEKSDEIGISRSDKDQLIREGKMTPFGTFMTTTTSKTVSIPRPSAPKGFSSLKGKSGPQMMKGPTKEEMIKSGEMTPFGSTMSKTKTVQGTEKAVNKSPGGLTDFEKYLQDQLSRQKVHHDETKGQKKKKKKTGDPTYGIAKKRKRKLKEYIGEENEEDGYEDSDDSTSLSSIKKKIKSDFHSKAAKQREEEHTKSKRKDPIKMKILHPKKRKKDVPLGSVTSEREVDQYKAVPRKILSESVAFECSDSEGFSDQNDSDSEYVPSDKDMDDDDDWNENDVDDDMKDAKGQQQGKLETLLRKRKRKKRKKSEDDWLTNDLHAAPKAKRSKRGKDDGNIQDYAKRIEEWKQERLRKKQEKILRGEDLDSDEEEEEGYEEFEGGYKIPLSIWNKLYKYQKTCVKWLWELHGQNCGGILGDEMGLGKTIQIISFLVGLSYSRLKYYRLPWKGLGPVLVVCPATVIHQWVKEFHKWWPPFRVAVLHDSGAFTGTRPALIHNINKYDGILVTSYTGVLAQLKVLLQYEWHYIILDEGHKIRNPEAQITVALKRFQTPHRLILSGSPIQNSLKELWSLFDFAFPGKLGTLPVFMSQFAVPITQGGYANASKIEVQTAFKCASILRDTINPYLLRRMKNDVRNHLNLPDKNEQVLFCDLSEEQRRAYKEYIDGDHIKLIMNGRMKVFVGLINLRKICNHPDLFTGGPRDFDGYESGLQPELKYGYWSRAGKMHVLQSILLLWSRQGHRVLLFTQSRQMMCILEKFLLDEQYCYLKMDGTTAVSARQPMIEKFNKDPSYFVFLLTTRVGGLGVNLTGADRVVIYDPDWNPSTDSQARERAWRIGQMRHVTIYRLLTAGTIEEKIYHRQIFKQFLTNRVLKDPKQQRFFKTNDMYELFSLNEGIKEKTESSAIFAGTGSEIKVNVKDKAEDTETKDSCNSVVSCSKKKVGEEIILNRSKSAEILKHAKGKQASRAESVSGSSSKGKEKASSVPSSRSKLDRMRELARSLSQKIGLKSKGKENVDKTSKSTDIDLGKSQMICKTEGEDTSDLMNPKTDNSIETTKTEVKEETNEIKHNEDDLQTVVKEESGSSTDNPLTFDTKEANSSIKRSTSSDSSSKPEQDIGIKSENSKSSVTSDSQGYEHSEKHKKKHKKKDKHKEKERSKDRHHKKGKKFEGERIQYLVKKRNYRKTEEEEEAEREGKKSQDQYVLEKLFQKSGVHTALSHDAILSNSDPDYLLMEGEAERVAKEALKAVRASRAQCFRPRISGNTGDSTPSKQKPKFGSKKSSIFKDVNEKESEKATNPEKKSKKKLMFNGGLDDDSDSDRKEETFSPIKKQKDTSESSSGMLSSSQLLIRMRQRNKVLDDSDDEKDNNEDDPVYPSLAPPVTDPIDPEVQENIDLLADIRNFVAFQAEVDGKAATHEIIDRFKTRLPTEQTPFFKAILKQICDFHRDTATGIGMWYLKEEFR